VTKVDWIRTNLAKHGREWCAAHYEQYKRETGSEMAPESYSVELRRQARELRAKVAPLQPAEATQSNDVHTLDDALHYHGVDEASYRVDKLTTNTWGSRTNPNQQIKVTLKPREELEPTPQEVAERFRALVEDYEPPQEMSAPTRIESGRVLEVSIPDIHIGKRIWGEAVGGESFGVEDSRALYLDAIQNLTAGLSNDYDAVLLPLGNDFFNVDGLQRSTTKGTPQPDSEHPLLAYDIGLLTAVDAIYYLSQFGPVHVPMVPGNHDRQLTYLLGWSLAAWFRTMDNVTIDNSPTLHKAYGAGNWGVVWHHGDRLKPHELAMLFADAYPELWARTEHREVHQGHLHHTRDGEMRATDESNGVRVRLLPSLVPADEWHDKHRYRALREAVSMEWDFEYGLQSQRFYHPGRRPIRGAA
jgi:hypothetical protein